MSIRNGREEEPASVDRTAPQIRPQEREVFNEVVPEGDSSNRRTADGIQIRSYSPMEREQRHDEKIHIAIHKAKLLFVVIEEAN